MKKMSPSFHFTLKSQKKKMLKHFHYRISKNFLTGFDNILMLFSLSVGVSYSLAHVCKEKEMNTGCEVANP